MTQDSSSERGTSRGLGEGVGTRRFLVIAGIAIAATGLVASVISAVTTVRALSTPEPLNIRGLLESEKNPFWNPDPPDFTVTWLWAAVVGIAFLIVGLARESSPSCPARHPALTLDPSVRLRRRTKG